MSQPALTDAERAAIHERFAQVPERGSTDHLLRLVQQHHVTLSMMADTKANIIITVSSIMLTLVLGRLSDPDLRIALMVLGFFTLLALLLAILAVLPKYRPIRHRNDRLPPGFNVLFFGHFAMLDEKEFMERMSAAMQPGQAYATVVRDVYSLGSYLAHHKYPYLRLSYLFFIAGFVLACLVAGVELALA